MRRDSVEDFFFGTDITPDDSDELIVRSVSDQAVAFLFLRRGVLRLTFLATVERNSLIMHPTEASLKFDSIVMAEGAENKRWTQMRIEAEPNGNLHFDVVWRETDSALAIPYDHTDAKWGFVLNRRR